MQHKWFSFFTFHYTYLNTELVQQPFTQLAILCKQKFPHVEQTKSSLSWSIHQLLYIPYKISVSTEEKEDRQSFIFSVDYKNFINVCVLVIIFAAFFSRFSLSFLLWFSGIFVGVFYIVHYLFFSSLFSRIISKISKTEVLDDILTPEQIEWMQNPNLCSACGTKISKYDAHCPECGLFLSKQSFSPYSTTEEKYIYTYTYKEES